MQCALLPVSNKWQIRNDCVFPNVSFCSNIFLHHDRPWMRICHLHSHSPSHLPQRRWSSPSSMAVSADVSGFGMQGALRPSQVTGTAQNYVRWIPAGRFYQSHVSWWKKTQLSTFCNIATVSLFYPYQFHAWFICWVLTHIDMTVMKCFFFFFFFFFGGGGVRKRNSLQPTKVFILKAIFYTQVDFLKSINMSLYQ